jgi:putative ABC transport system permease protein
MAAPTVFWENVRLALDQLLLHKMRSLLTALGVIIGILAVTLMGTAIQGIDKGFSESLDMLGQDNFYIEKWPWRDVGDEWMKYRNRRDMRLDYADQLNELMAATPNSKLRVAVPALGGSRPINRGDSSVSNAQLLGTTADFSLITTADIAHGRFFNRTEDIGGWQVIILGADVARALFPDGPRSALDQTVTIRGHKFTVIGVLARQGQFLGMQSFDRQAILPIRALRKFHRGDRGAHIRVQKLASASVADARDELTGHLRRIRGLQPEDEDDFEINQSDTIEEQLGPIKSGIALAGFFVTGLALFVGAIGIMNITFVSVKERTREIGTRRALGARRSTILLQFLVEAVAVCLLGGLVGVGLAFGVNQMLVNALPAFPFVFSFHLVVIALVLSVLTGIASGIAPAWQAANLDPATALRHE